MKKHVVAAFILLIATSGLALAQGSNPEGGWSEHGRAHHIKHGGWGFYSKKLGHLLARAGGLELNDSQRSQITAIQDKHLFPIIKREADLKIAHIKLMEQLRDPGFNSDTLKSQIKELNSIELEIANRAVDTMAELRKAIGKENYEELVGGMPWKKRR